jgi:hypothetical protein
MPTEDSSNKTNIREFNPFLSIIRPFKRTLPDGTVFEQTVDGREFTDHQEIIHEQLEKLQEEQEEQTARYESTIELHVENTPKNHSNPEPENTEDPNNDPSPSSELTDEEKEEMLQKVKSAKLLGKTHSTIDRQEVEAVTSHIGETIDASNAIFDLNEDGQIDNVDVEYVRTVIRWQYDKAGILINQPDNVNIEDLVKFTIRPTSGNAVVYINNIEAPAKAIAVYPGTDVAWKVISCNKYIEEGVETVTEQKTLTVMIEEDCTAATFCSAAQRSYGGNIHLTEDVSKGVIAQGVAATGRTIIDMGGHSYYSSDTGRPAMLIRGFSQYSISNCGTISSATTTKPLLWTNSASCSLTINDGEYISEDGSGECIYNQGGTIIINGGIFKNPAEGSDKYLLNCYDSAYASGSAKIIVRGGKFYNFDPSNSNDGNFVDEGYVVEGPKTDNEGNIYYEVIPE